MSIATQIVLTNLILLITWRVASNMYYNLLDPIEMIIRLNTRPGWVVRALNTWMVVTVGLTASHFIALIWSVP